MLPSDTDERIRRRHRPQPFRLYIMMLMAAAYVGLGILLIVAPEGMFPNLPSTPRQILGGVIVIYGLIRFVRILRQHLRQHHDSD